MSSSLTTLLVVAAAVAVVSQQQLFVASVLGGAAYGAASAVARAAHREPVARSRAWWLDTVPSLSEERFRRTFRVPRSVFERIVEDATTADMFTPAPHNAARMLPVDLQVALTLWRLGRTTSVFDVADKFGVAEGSVINACDRVARFILHAYEASTVALPDTSDPRAMQKLSLGWQSLGVLRKVVSAVDGTLIPIQRPAHEPDLYFTRKGFHAINMQIACDHLYRITCTWGGLPGKVYDGNAIRNSRYWDWLLTIPEGFYALADSGYQAMKSLVIPFRKPAKRTLLAAMSRFNYFHAVSRNISEKVNGVLKNRFRWMLFGACFGSVATTVLYFRVCCVLHNMCIDAKDSFSLGRDDDMHDEPAFYQDLPEKEYKDLRDYINEQMSLYTAPSTRKKKRESAGDNFEVIEEGAPSTEVKASANDTRLGVFYDLLVRDFISPDDEDNEREVRKHKARHPERQPKVKSKTKAKKKKGGKKGKKGGKKGHR